MEPPLPDVSAFLSISVPITPRPRATHVPDRGNLAHREANSRNRDLDVPSPASQSD